ncbi:hypothetical protein ACWGCW_32225 [Streptomyces sp. NPDC054933]
MIAVHLLEWLDERGKRLEEINQGDVDEWLADGSGYRYTVRYFLGWAMSRGLVASIKVPCLPRRQPERFLGDDEHLRQLQRCLRDTDLPIDVRVAGVIVLLFGVPLPRVLRLTSNDLDQSGDGVSIKLGTKPLDLPPRLADLTLELLHANCHSSVIGRAGGGARFLFPGLVAGQAVQPSGFSVKLSEFGIIVPAACNTARLALASDLPACVIADLFGMHINTAVRWVRYAKRDWLDYVVTRAEGVEGERSTTRVE